MGVKLPLLLALVLVAIVGELPLPRRPQSAPSSPVVNAATAESLRLRDALTF